MHRWIAVALVVASCGAAPGTPSASSTTAASPTPPPSAVVVPNQIADLDVVTITIDGRELVVAVADTLQERVTGLMFITDLDDLDGMVFVYENDTATTFHMLNTFLPLDIAFFTADGSFVSKTTMEPCPDDDCPDHRAADRYRYAIEVPAGAFDWVGETSRLDVAPLTG